MFLVGICPGIIAAMLDQPGSGVLCAAVLVAIYGAYNEVLPRNSGIFSGFVVGGILGLAVGTAGFLIGGQIEGIKNGALFGLSRGLLIGAMIGVVSRAETQKGDTLFTRWFLILGSIGLGAILGGGVGVIAGTVLGIIGKGMGGVLVGLLIGGVVGGYLGSSWQNVRYILIGITVGVGITAVCLFIGGAISGLILGAFSGSISPMLLVASIAAFGGFSSRGFKAMLLEALEAPSEMLEQGAVPFLVPAVITGAIIGTAASGTGSLFILPATLAIVGLSFGALGDMDARPNTQITMRSIVEMAMMGAEEWPVGQVIVQVTGKNGRKALLGTIKGLLIGSLGSLLAYYLTQWIIQLFTR